MTSESELEEVLATMVYFAPAYSTSVTPFITAHRRACTLLVERGCALSRNEMIEKVEEWKKVLPDGAVL